MGKTYSDDGNVDVRNVLPDAVKRRTRTAAEFVYTPESPGKRAGSRAGKGTAQKSTVLSGKRTNPDIIDGRRSSNGPETAKKRLFDPLSKQKEDSDSDVVGIADESDEEPFAGSDASDDYQPSDVSSEDDEEIETDSEGDSSPDEDDEDEDQENRDPVEEAAMRSVPGNVATCSRRIPKRSTNDVFLRKMSRGSGGTLAGLEIKRLDNDTIVSAVTKYSIKRTHPGHHEALTSSSELKFIHWLTLMNKGFNLLLYGLGSKRSLLKKFTSQFLGTDRTHITFNGYLPNATIRSLMSAIIENLLEMDMPSSLEAQLKVIESFFDGKESGPSGTDDNHLYLIFHGFEHTVSSDAKQKAAFRRALMDLGRMKRIHIIAAVDNIGVDALFDFAELALMRFARIHVTTYEPYLKETWWAGSSAKFGLASKFSLRCGDEGSVALSALRHLFTSLTKNAKEIFFVIARHELEKGADAEDMAFIDLFQTCRDDMLVSSDAGLRGQLREFVDHKVLTFGKRKSDGQETVRIPLEHSVISQFLDDYADDC